MKNTNQKLISEMEKTLNISKKYLVVKNIGTKIKVIGYADQRYIAEHYCPKGYHVQATGILIESADEKENYNIIKETKGAYDQDIYVKVAIYDDGLIFKLDYGKAETSLERAVHWADEENKKYHPCLMYKVIKVKKLPAIQLTK